MAQLQPDYDREIRSIMQNAQNDILKLLPKKTQTPLPNWEQIEKNRKQISDIIDYARELPPTTDINKIIKKLLNHRTTVAGIKDIMKTHKIQLSDIKSKQTRLPHTPDYFAIIENGGLPISKHIRDQINAIIKKNR